MTEPMLCETLSGYRGVRHGFFTRAGGVSDGLYASLNCGLGSGDVQDRIVENRQRVSATLAGTKDPGPLLTAYQVHSAEAILVTEPWPEDARPKVDGLVTTVPGLAVGVLTADCGPVLLADETHGVVAATHAGWKGAIGGVLEATVSVMERAGAQRSSIHAVLGPCISQPSYEVGPEFRDHFLAQNPAFARFFDTPPAATRPHFDLPGFIVNQLKDLGLGSVNDLATCTYRDENSFFSFRRATHRDETDYGRQISAILLV